MLKQQFLTSLTDSFATFTGVGQQQYDRAGDIRYEGGGSGLAAFKFIKSTGTLAFAIGDFLSYTDATLQNVDATTAAVPCGVAMFANATGGALWGWTQILGLATLNTNFSTAPAAGNKVTNAGAANKTLKVAAAVTDPHAGIAVNVTNLVQLTCGL